MDNSEHTPELMARLLAENAKLHQQVELRNTQIGSLSADLAQATAQKQELEERNEALALDRDNWKSRAVAWTPAAS